MSGVSVVFLCTANRCRSLMAECCLRGILAGLPWGDQVQVSSAGIMYEEYWTFLQEFLASHGRSLEREQYYGALPYPATVSVLKKRGWEVQDYRSREVSAELVNSANLIIAMEDAQKNAVAARYPEAVDRVFTLRELAKDSSDLLLEDGFVEPVLNPDDPQLINYGEEYVELNYQEIERCLNRSLPRLWRLLSLSV